MAKAAVSAATSATSPVIDPGYSVNDPAGYPAQERYPGAVDPAQYGVNHAPTTAGGVSEVVQTGNQPYGSVVPEYAAGGGVFNSDYLSGHDGPQEAWDSSAGAPFAPSGAINPELHGHDTGGVYQFETVIPAEIGELSRHTTTGQTTVRNGSGDQVTKDNVTSPNNRTNMDQQQWHNPDGGEGGFAPYEIPYSERAIYNNLAYEAEGITPTDSHYTPSGFLPDRSPHDYKAQAYQAPADPSMESGQTPATGDPGIGGGWV
jgi:hypothetical protein